jgi:hypothetical protein
VTGAVDVTSFPAQSNSLTLCGTVWPERKRLFTSASVATSFGALSSARGGANATRSGCRTFAGTVAVVVCPDASVAVQVAVFAPKLLPGTDEHCTVLLPVQMSVADGGAIVSGVDEHVPTSVLLPSVDKSKDGPLVSCTVMKLEQLVVRPD